MSSAPSLIGRLLPEGLQPRNITVSPSDLTVHAQVALASAGCPLCSYRSAKVHTQSLREDHRRLALAQRLRDAQDPSEEVLLRKPPV